MELTVSIKKRLRDFPLIAEFTVKDEVFALLGASGCGKSMTLKCIAGIETPDEGRIVLDRCVLFDSTKGINLSPQERRVGYLFQNHALFPNMTIGENIRFVMKDGTKSARKARQLLERFRLEELEDAYPSALSGGQAQRVALLRILAADAKILLLDEPFSALDGYLKWQLEMELMDELPSYGGAAIFVSHDRGEVYRLAQKAAVMHRGYVEKTSSKEELFKNPKTLAAMLLTGCKNVSPAKRQEDCRIFAVRWGLSLTTAAEPPAGLRYVGIRAHAPEVRERGEEGENVFPVEVVREVEDTFAYILMVRPKGTEAHPIRWEIEKKEWLPLRGKEFSLYFPPDSLILLEH